MLFKGFSSISSKAAKKLQHSVSTLVSKGFSVRDASATGQLEIATTQRPGQASPQTGGNIHRTFTARAPQFGVLQAVNAFPVPLH